jgi:hypothetical protein
MNTLLHVHFDATLVDSLSPATFSIDHGLIDRMPSAVDKAENTVQKPLADYLQIRTIDVTQERNPPE